MLKNGHAWHFKTYDKRPEFARVRDSTILCSYLFCSLTDFLLHKLCRVMLTYVVISG
jgi:hypothetical protein